jgi:hypothetical protein
MSALAHEVRRHKSPMIYDGKSSACCPPFRVHQVRHFLHSTVFPFLSPSVPRHLIATEQSPAAPPRSRVPRATGAPSRPVRESSNHERVRMSCAVEYDGDGHGGTGWNGLRPQPEGRLWPPEAYVPTDVTRPSFPRLNPALGWAGSKLSHTAPIYL